MNNIEKFMFRFSLPDIGRSFSYNDSHYDDSSLAAGYITFVTVKDIGMPLGTTNNYVTKKLCDTNTYVRITDLGESVLHMEEL